jgi:hypothetical protein
MRGATDLERIRSVWSRTPGPFRLPDTLSAAETAAYPHRGQVRPGRGSADPSGAVGEPAGPVRDGVLQAAATGGRRPGRLTVPDTPVANTASAVLNFAGSGPVVTKMLAASGITEDGARRVAYTREVTAADLDDLVGVESTTHMCQQRVAKAFDARVVAFKITGVVQTNRTTYFRSSYRT